MAKGKIEADRFIQQLTAEMAALKEDLAARATLEQVLDRLDSRTSNDDHRDSSHQSPDDRSASQAAISPDAIERLIEAKITKRDTERTARENRDLAVAKLKEAYGAEYSKRLEEKCEALGIDKDTLNSLAARSPTAFLELVLPKSQERAPYVPPRSPTNGAAPSSTQVQPGTKAWYDALRKSDPTTYWTPKVQWRLHEDAIKAANENREF